MHQVHAKIQTLAKTREHVIIPFEWIEDIINATAYYSILRNATAHMHKNVFNIKRLYIYELYEKYIYIYLLRMLCTLVSWDSCYVMDVLLASYSCSYQETVEFWVNACDLGINKGSCGYFNFFLFAFFYCHGESNVKYTCESLLIQTKSEGIYWQFTLYTSSTFTKVNKEMKCLCVPCMLL